VIHFNSVTKRFGDKVVLNGITFSVKQGEILFILGRSGTGKSVTLKTLVGLLKPDDGQVMIEWNNQQHSIGNLDADGLAQARRVCGMVFQHPALLDSLTIEENISFGLRDWPMDKKRQRVHECLKMVHLDEDILCLKPPEISYGMQKRVSIARTIAPQPKALLFDEPTTGLDPITTNAINGLIVELSRQLGTTSIVVSHDMGCALSAADRIIVLDGGRILAQGTVAEIKNSREPLIVDFLSEALTIQ
jgi:phospholipid/cholesterol/gamma-HCH transport system ATP-binding protein